MKFIVSTILTALLTYALGFFLPWWSVAIAAGLVAFFVHQKAGWAFLSGFLGIGLLWFVLSFVISAQNEGILANRISELILKKQSPTNLMALTAVIGALVGGFGALTGSLLKGVLGKTS